MDTSEGHVGVRLANMPLNAPSLSPKILQNLCFSFLLGITAVPGEIENNAYAKFWGKIRCIMADVQVAYTAFTQIKILRRGECDLTLVNGV